jgi:hypothetical protein
MSSSGAAVMHMRVLKAISPIAPTSPPYERFLAMPEVGELLRRPDGRSLEFKPIPRNSVAFDTLLRRDLKAALST